MNKYILYLKAKNSVVIHFDIILVKTMVLTPEALAMAMEMEFSNKLEGQGYIRAMLDLNLLDAEDRPEVMLVSKAHKMVS